MYIFQARRKACRDILKPIYCTKSCRRWIIRLYSWQGLEIGQYFAWLRRPHQDSGLRHVQAPNILGQVCRHFLWNSRLYGSRGEDFDDSCRSFLMASKRMSDISWVCYVMASECAMWLLLSVLCDGYWMCYVMATECAMWWLLNVLCDGYWMCYVMATEQIVLMILMASECAMWWLLNVLCDGSRMCYVMASEIDFWSFSRICFDVFRGTCDLLKVYACTKRFFVLHQEVLIFWCNLSLLLQIAYKNEFLQFNAWDVLDA